jgi:hypothetical protein
MPECRRWPEKAVCHIEKETKWFTAEIAENAEKENFKIISVVR